MNLNFSSANLRLPAITLHLQHFNTTLSHLTVTTSGHLTVTTSSHLTEPLHQFVLILPFCFFLRYNYFARVHLLSQKPCCCLLSLSLRPGETSVGTLTAYSFASFSNMSLSFSVFFSFTESLLPVCLVFPLHSLSSYSFWPSR